MKSLTPVFALVLFFSTSLTFAAPTAQEQQAIAKLSPYDKELINDYTSLGFALNGGFRDYVDQRTSKSIQVPFDASSPASNVEDFERDAYRTKYLLHLNRALAKIPNFRQIVYRGIYSSEPPEERFVKNRIVVERRFTSTTTDISVAEEFARGKDKNTTCGACDPSIVDPNPKMMVLLQIESKTGKNISALNEDEKEILFPYGVVFKTKEVFRETTRKIKAPCTKNKKEGICEYTGFLVVKMEELDSTMSTDDGFELEKSENRRNQNLVQKHFDGKIENFSAAIKRNNDLYTEWRQQGNSMDQEDLTFGEGGD